MSMTVGNLHLVCHCMPRQPAMSMLQSSLGLCKGGELQTSALYKAITLMNQLLRASKGPRAPDQASPAILDSVRNLLKHAWLLCSEAIATPVVPTAQSGLNECCC